jgi:type III restriction enzyme
MKFEKYCESIDSVKWLYKNGDKGAEFFSIVYEDAFGKSRVFFPDYIVGVDGEVWIIETKGGFDKYGNSEDIDKFSPRKFEVLKAYLTRNNMNGGFVREDKKENALCICMGVYSEDAADWPLLSGVIK